jgi:hypothetical protein
MRGRLWATIVALLFGACSLPESGTGPAQADAEPDVTTLPLDGGSDAVSADAGGADATADAAIDAPPVYTAGYALDFDGGSYVAIGPFMIPADFTIEAWVEPTSTAGETYVVAEDRDTQGQGQFRFGIAAGKLFFMMTDASGSSHGLYNNGYSLMTPQTIPTGMWTHVAVSKSGTAFQLVVNGVSAATFGSTTPTIVYGGPPVVLRLAARVASDGTDADGAFDGTIDEVRFWNQARSPTEIASTMSMEISPASAGLMAYWRFDEGSGSTTADQETAYSGTLVGSPLWVVSTAF